MSIKSGYISLPFPLCVPSSAVYCIYSLVVDIFLVSLIWTTSVSGFGVGLGREEGRGLDWEAHLFPTLPSPFLIR
jgi:hypothetical protein